MGGWSHWHEWMLGMTWVGTRNDTLECSEWTGRRASWDSHQSQFKFPCFAHTKRAWFCVRINQIEDLSINIQLFNS